MTKWTKEQLDAIEVTDTNLLVAAAAGSGKTTVLVERIIRKITNSENPCDIDSLLVVTFTNAAASEMKERIGDAIAQKIEEQPQNHILQRQLILLNKANITTIHSFCLNIIRNNFHLIDLDPGFRVGDTTEIDIIKKEAIEETLENFYEEKEKGFLNLVESYANGKGDYKIEEIISRVYNFSISAPFPLQWLEEKVQVLNINEDFNFSSSPWGEILKENVKRNFRYSLEEGKKILAGLDGFPPKYIDAFNEIIKISEAVLITENFYEIADILRSAKISALSGKTPDDEIKELASDFKKEFMKIIASNLASIDKSEEDIKAEIKHCYPLMKSLIELVKSFIEVFGRKKRERGVIDFNDIEHFALNILTNSEGGEVLPSKVALEYRDRFTEILVDEYQDSNYVQEYILDTISKKDIGNRFMVGDVKQSIYRFRQAKPEIFLDKYNTFSEVGGEDKDKGQKVLLYKNFRSRETILNGVNFIFERIMSEEVGELSYTEKERLNVGADFNNDLIKDFEAGGKIELNLIEDVKNEDDEDDLDKITLEARFVADKIKDLVNSEKPFKVYDKNPDTGEREYRTIKYKDIVVLLRSTKNTSNVFEEELSLNGIPCFSDTGGGYFDAIEVKTIIALLKVVDNPFQDIPLLSVLKSPIFSFTSEDMVDLRASHSGYFYECLKVLADEENEIGIKCKTVIEKIKDFQLKAKNLPIDKFLWYIYEDTGYYTYVGALPNAYQRQANLKVLFERAREFMSTSFKGIFSFINFIDKLKTSNKDMSGAKTLSENEDVVRIMSIHKSKGLEFPVCICSGFGKKFNQQDFRESILLHGELGFGPEIVDLNKRIKYKSALKEAIKTKIQIETQSEEMRILYVAFTRAKEKLIITSTVKGIHKKVAEWSGFRKGESLNEAKVLNAKSYIELIAPVILSNENEIPYFKSNIIYKKDVLMNSEEEIKKSDDILKTLENMSKEYETEEKEEINRRLSFKYPREYLGKIPSKLSVTETKRIINIIEDDLDFFHRSFIIKTPNFLRDEKRLTPSERGSIMHFIMQKVDLDKHITIDYLKGKIKSLVEGEFLTEEEAESVNAFSVYKFFQSNLGKRMLKSNNVKREVPFHMEIPVDYIYKEYKDSNEKIAIQGIIDSFFEEDGELVLIDYKTDYVTEDNMSEIYEQYKIQLDLYSKALEDITGKKVKEKYIYLLGKGLELKY